ncbi:unknown [Prevotella sp. CAG:485]|nr:unknown [Prevotella sp. CAG:485]
MGINEILKKIIDEKYCISVKSVLYLHPNNTWYCLQQTEPVLFNLY